MLTDLACRSLIAKSKQLGKPLKKYDKRGLFLYALPKGTAYWRQKYSIYGKENQISFGPYPEISLSEARLKHAEAYKLVLDNIDPAKARQEAARKAEKQSKETFEAVGRAWHKHNIDRWSIAHGAEILARMKSNLFPPLGRVPVAELTRKQILEAVQKIEARQSHEMARRCLQYAKRSLTYAQDEELVQFNVAQGLEGSLKPYKRRHFPSMEIAMLPEFLRRFDRNEVGLPDNTRHTIEALMHTLVRVSELVKMEWSELDLISGLWIIPARRMKMRRDHIVPISRQMVHLFRQLQQANSALPADLRSRYVFTGQRGPHRPMDKRRLGLALFALGYKDIHTSHGFRALGMGIAKEKLGYRHEVPDRQLAHVSGDEVRRAYDRAKFLDERKEMMQHLSNYIDGLRSPKGS